MRLLNSFILRLIKPINTERYELLHPLAKNVKSDIDNYIISLDHLSKKPHTDNLTSNYGNMLNNRLN